MNDFRIFLDFCKVYLSGARMSGHLKTNAFLEIELCNPSLYDSILNRYGGDPKINGVEITCRADNQHIACEKFLAVETPPFHPIFDNQYTKPTELTKLIDLPLLVHNVYHMAWKGEYMNQVDITNLEVECLYISVEVCKDTWGIKGLGSPSAIMGRYLVRREDEEDITPHQVEAIVAFFRTEIYPKMSSERGRLIGKLKEKKREAKEKFLEDYFARAKFEEFFVKYKKGKIEGGDDSWTEEISPYEGQDVDVADDFGQLDLNDESDAPHGW
jgi:hypothetical protein